MKKCKAQGCGVRFQSAQPFRTWCSPECGLLIARAKKEQADQRKRSEERKQDRARREKLKTRKDWIKDAQDAVNYLVRVRDNGRSCISCATTLQLGGTGGGFDAGHYRSRGSAPHLRFDRRNIHGQCKRCNQYLAGNAVEYRAGLIERFGAKFVDELEADQTPRKHTVEELKQIIKDAKQEAKELQK